MESTYTWKNKILIFLDMIVIGFATEIVAAFVLTAVLGWFPDVSKQYQEGIGTLLVINAKMLIFVCVVAPLLEELFFRGLVLGLLKKVTPFMVANVIQALAFGIYHGNIVQGIYAFILGLFIGYVLNITGSIVFTIALHMSINFSGMFIDKIIPENSPFIANTIAALISFIVIVGLIGDVNRRRKRNNNTDI